jgi:hypothetical protein
VADSRDFAPTDPAVQVKPKPTLGQENALAKAESYLSFTAFSAKGLAEQLAFEGFAQADIDYAMANIKVDWNAQAAAKAESYLSFTSMSAQGLREQLEFEGFTPEQVAFGVAAVGY